jgi:hypothetical protein
MMPAQQRLAAGDRLGLGIEQRLIEHLELAFHQGAAQVELQRTPLLQLRIHLGLEKAMARPALGLGPIQRHVGAAQHLVGIPSVVGGQRDADAGADHHVVAVDVIGLAQCRDQALGKGPGMLRSGDVSLQDGKLIAAQPGDRIEVAHAIAQASGHGAQQRIAGPVTKRIVDAFEVIEVEAENGMLFAAADAGEGLAHLLVKRHPIGQIGKRVVARHVPDLGLGLGALGDVLMGGDPSAARHRLVDQRNDAAVGRLDDLARGVALRDLGQQLGAIAFRISGEVPRRLAALEEVAQQDPGLHLIGRQAIHLDVTLIAHDEPGIGVEHAQPLRHVVERRIEQLVLILKLLLVLAETLVLSLEFGGDRPVGTLHRSKLGARCRPAAVAAIEPCKRARHLGNGGRRDLPRQTGHAVRLTRHRELRCAKRKDPDGGVRSQNARDHVVPIRAGRCGANDRRFVRRLALDCRQPDRDLVQVVADGEFNARIRSATVTDPCTLLGRPAQQNAARCDHWFPRRAFPRPSHCGRRSFRRGLNNSLFG